MVHFLDADEEQLWTDDHDPGGADVAVEARARPSSTPGRCSFRFSRTWDRRPSTWGCTRAAMGAGIRCAARRRGSDRTRSGRWNWCPDRRTPSSSTRTAGTTRRWRGTTPPSSGNGPSRQATLSFRNPKRDATFYLHLDGRPDLLASRCRCRCAWGNRRLTRSRSTPGRRSSGRSPSPRRSSAKPTSVDVTIEVSQTFVPSLVPAAQSNDARELGVRVFHAYIEPK